MNNFVRVWMLLKFKAVGQKIDCILIANCKQMNLNKIETS